MDFKRKFFHLKRIYLSPILIVVEKDIFFRRDFIKWLILTQLVVLSSFLSNKDNQYINKILNSYRLFDLPRETPLFP